MSQSVMKVEEVAKYLGFSVKKIYRLAETNRIPASRIGRQYRFVKAVIDDWLRDKSIFVKPDWGQRLDLILNRMRDKASKKEITSRDIQNEIKSVRAQKRENP